LAYPISRYVGIPSIDKQYSEDLRASMFLNHRINDQWQMQVAGTTLYIPVHVSGALFSVGDAHAGQGNGEVSLAALETVLSGVFRFNVRKGERLLWPRAETPTHFMTMGFDENLDVAIRTALRGMIDFLGERYKLSREDAYLLASDAVDFSITQLVDGKRGVHAMIPKSIFQRQSLRHQ
ncbi:MAG: acetamidase/formamidase family protein, partial [Bryobacteraceae bacterium]